MSRPARVGQLATRIRRLVTLLLAIPLALDVVTGVAWAYWSADSSPGGGGASGATAVAPGNVPTASATGDSVTVRWVASTLLNGVPVSGYVVTRYDAGTRVSQTILPSCTGRVAGTSCTEHAVPVGRWVYTVTPVFAANWRGAESPASAPVTIGGAPRVDQPATPTAPTRTPVQSKPVPITPVPITPVPEKPVPKKPVPITPAPAPLVVSIAGGSTAATTTASPTISGTTSADAGTVVTVSVGGQSMSATTGNDGSWTVTTDPLTIGAHQVVASVRNAADDVARAVQVLTIHPGPLLVDRELGGAGGVDQRGGSHSWHGDREPVRHGEADHYLVADHLHL